MNRFTLQRVTFSRDCPTFGMLLSQGLPLCLTLERAWDDNKHNTSCIPPGIYRATKYMSPSKGCMVLLLHGVPGRENVEVHAGNTIMDTQGCILTGFEIAGASVLKSRDALQHVLLAAPTECEIEVINPPT